MLQKVGFEKAELVGETGFNSTPKTKGVLLRAEKPANVKQTQELVEDTKRDEGKLRDTMEKRTKPSTE